MASVYRVTRKTGRTDRKWYARYWDAQSRKWRSAAGYADRMATLALGERLERDSARRAEGLPTPPPRHDDIPPMEADLDAWMRSMIAKGSGRTHASSMRRMVDTVATACRWPNRHAIVAEDAETFLTRCRAEDAGPSSGSGQGRRRRKFGASAYNHYIAALRAFGAWLSRPPRSTPNHLASLSAIPTEPDRRHLRRSLSEEQFASLIQAAQSGPTWGASLDGPRRAVLYLLASLTGLRASEIASLTAVSFAIDGDPPTVTVTAGYSKRKRRDMLPIHADLASVLRPVLAGCRAGDPVFPGRWHPDAAAMLRGDLASAGIPYRSDDGRVFDFHSLRRQFVTSLARARVGLAQAQRLARHSTPVLTANFYTDVELADMARDLSRVRMASPSANTGANTGPLGSDAE